MSEEYDEFLPIDPHIQNETRDFVDEVIVLLLEAQRLKMIKESWTLHDDSPWINEREKKHLVLYNWIALSLVRAPHADVAAIAVYRFKDSRGTEVYYSKNEVKPEDESHAQEFAALIRETASSAVRVGIHEFQSKYFQLIFNNCRGKLDRRLKDLRDIFSNRDKALRDDDGKMDMMPTYRELVVHAIRSAISENKQDPYDGRNRRRADEELLSLTKANTVYEALDRLFQSIQHYARSELSAQTLHDLCAQCWMFANSHCMELLTYGNSQVKAVVSSASKLGEYFRGTARVYAEIYHPEWNESLQTFNLLSVPSTESRKVQLEADWHHVIETVYTRVVGQPPDISKGRLFGKLQGVINGYTSWTKTFSRHAEIELIEYLEQRKYHPVVIGVSKLCCSICNAWIDRMNSQYYIHRWKVAGCHGRFYQWSRNVDAGSSRWAAETAVRDFVYKALVDLITPFIPSPGESPVYMYEYRDLGPEACQTVLLYSSSMGANYAKHFETQ
jgi:hypothetical protein